MNNQGPEWERLQTKRVYSKYENCRAGSDDEDELLSRDGKFPDQFGFLQTERYLQNEKKILKTTKKTTVRREKKWSKMLHNYERHLKKKLPSRVYKGVPNKVRAGYWNGALEPDSVKDTYNFQGTTYRMLYDSMSDDVEIVRQIDLDVARTWRLHEKFFTRYSQGQRSCFRILLAYAALDTEVGYCQGMSQIAALLMIVFNDEKKAFWGLVALMNKVPWAQRGMFAPHFPKLSRFCAYWENILQKHMPRVYRHLENESLISQIYLTKWFLQNFLDRMPFRIAVRLWDCFLLDGDVVVLAATYILFKSNHRKICQLSFEDLTPFLQNDICNLTIPDDTFFLQIQKVIPLMKAMITLPPVPPELPTFRKTASLPAKGRENKVIPYPKAKTALYSRRHSNKSSPDFYPIREGGAPSVKWRLPGMEKNGDLKKLRGGSDLSKPVNRIEVMPSKEQSESYLKHSRHYPELIQQSILSNGSSNHAPKEYL